MRTHWPAAPSGAAGFFLGIGGVGEKILGERGPNRTLTIDLHNEGEHERCPRSWHRSGTYLAGGMLGVI